MESTDRSRLDRIEANLEKLERLVQQNSDDLKETSRKWDERFYQLTKDNLNISRTIIITAGVAIIFSPLLRELAPTIKVLLDQFISKIG